jgi:predicted outer membrane lipoprotein
MDQDALVGALLTTIFGLMAALVLALLDARSKRKEAQRQTAANFEVEVTKAVRGDRVEAYRRFGRSLSRSQSSGRSIIRPFLRRCSVRAFGAGTTRRAASF